MGLRPQEEIASAEAFCGTLRNVVQMTFAEDGRPWPTPAQSANEESGREGGDEMLRHWATTPTIRLRSCDLVRRRGADES